MKKITLTTVAVVFAISAAFSGSVSQEGYYLWNAMTQSYDKLNEAPDPAWIERNCRGSLIDCYYTLDETGTVKNSIDFKN